MTRDAPERSVVHSLEVSLLAAAIFVLAGCDEPAAELQVVGGAEVRVASLGVVEMPPLALSDGQPIEGATWRVDDESVAQVQQGEVVAQRSGSTRAVADWEGQSVEVQLIVEPQLELRFERVPATLRVGETFPLSVQARQGRTVVAPDAMQYSTADPAILEVSAAGTLTARSPGMGYVTAATPGGEAMAEVRVVEE